MLEEVEIIEFSPNNGQSNDSSLRLKLNLEKMSSQENYFSQIVKIFDELNLVKNDFRGQKMYYLKVCLAIEMVKNIKTVNQISTIYTKMFHFLIEVLDRISASKDSPHFVNIFAKIVNSIVQLTQALKKGKQYINLRMVKKPIIQLFNRLKFRGVGTHNDFEGFLPEGLCDNMTDIDTEIRDMVLFVWVNASEESRTQISSLKQENLGILSKPKFDYIIAQLNILENQVKLFSNKCEEVLSDIYTFRYILYIYSDLGSEGKSRRQFLENFKNKNSKNY